jgi:large subunit ribosomal protein L30
MVEVTTQMPKLKPKAAPKAEVPKAETKPKKAEPKGDLIAAVLIRGREMGVRHDMRQTLDILKLRRRHVCVVYTDSASVRGSLHKVKDLITYGPISAETFAELNAKRGSLKDRDGKPINVFRMHPPRGGYGHKGIKVSYQQGGCLGLRRKGMDAFLAKMM